MSITYAPQNVDSYYQFEFNSNISPLKGILKKEHPDFFEIENPILDDPKVKINPIDNVIYVAKSQILLYYKINKG